MEKVVKNTMASARLRFMMNHLLIIGDAEQFFRSVFVGLL